MLCAFFPGLRIIVAGRLKGPATTTTSSLNQHQGVLTSRGVGRFFGQVLIESIRSLVGHMGFRFDPNNLAIPLIMSALQCYSSFAWTILNMWASAM